MSASRLVSVLLLALGACAADPPAASGPASAPAAGGGVGSWFRDRSLDLLDVASVRVGIGPSLLVHARATRWLAVGAGALGKPGGRVGGFAFPLHQLGTLRREGGAWTERRAEVGISVFYYFEAEATSLAGNRATFGPAARGTYDVGAELFLALIGAAAEVRPDEALDFVVGWFGLDPLGDDGP